MGSFSAMDLAFHYPRFDPKTHLPVSSGLPDVLQAKAAVDEGIVGTDKALPLLARSQEIFENLGAHMPVIASMYRPVVASRIAVAKRLPRSHVLQGSVDNFDQWVAETSARALNTSLDVWNRQDELQFDTTCVLLSQFVESVCKLKSALTPNVPQHFDSNTFQCEGFTLAKAMTLVDELLVMSERLARLPENREVIKRPGNNVSWVRVKLYLLKSLLILLTTGNGHRSDEMVEQCIVEVEGWTMEKGHTKTFWKPIRKGVPELGLLYQIRAEYLWRLFDWDTFPKEATDDKVIRAMGCSLCYHHYLPQDSQFLFDPTMDSAPADATEVQELDAYSTCLLSCANFFLSMPQPDASKAPFSHRMRFSTSPIVTVMSGSPTYSKSTAEPQPLTLHAARKRAQRCLERALKTNRRLFPAEPNNAKAGWMLLSMACLYADLKDYLFSVGLFNKAKPCFLENYGPNSDEFIHFLSLEAQCLQSLGSGKEAESRNATIAAIRQRRGIVAPA